MSGDDSDNLKNLPRSVFRELGERLARGDRVNSVAKWVMTKHRGGLQHEGHYAIRKYVAAFKCRMEEEGSPHLTPGQLDLQAKARAMSPTSRMFVTDLANSVRRILKLEKEVREAEMAPAPPESSMPEGEKK